ncbi:MAG TPA: biotin/lipoyl-binding protein, partial [Quisquiliibacterium sp.]|nr:biotin/lipoyl-binding protein [Quisquiliibacterium sp.]
MRRAKLLLPILLLAGAALFWWLGTDRDPPQPLAERYRLAAVERGALEQSVSASGTLNPVTLVNVGTQVSGTIRAVHADFNQRVSAGQPLAEIDP